MLASAAVADVALLAVVYAMIRIAAWTGAQIDRRTGRRWLGWMGGLSVAVGIFSASLPTITALTGVQCQGDVDYGACVSGD